MYFKNVAQNKKNYRFLMALLFKLNLKCVFFLFESVWAIWGIKNQKTPKNLPKRFFAKL
jgi:hypothetical protein